MSVILHDFGPVPNLRFDLRVARYLQSSTPSELAEMREFFEKLQRGKISVDGIALPSDVWLISVANHIVELRFTNPGTAIITRIQASMTSSH